MKNIVRDYQNQEQFKQINVLDGFQMSKIDRFMSIFENEKVIDFHVAQKCVPNNFYYFFLKTNETKANRMYLYQDGDSFTVDFISEWKDKQKGITVRNIKKSIENISIDNLMMILKTI